MTEIDERAKKSIHEYYSCDGEYSCERNGDCIMSGGYNTPFDCCECTAEDYEQGYIKGATEQHDIDIEKAVEWIRNNAVIGLMNEEVEDFVEDFKKAMEE